VLQRITPSRLTPPNVAPVRSALVKFVAVVSGLILLTSKSLAEVGITY
jgi:hypothetical protein